MRSIILTIVVLGALIGAFVVFMSMQEQNPGSQSNNPPTPTTRSTAALNPRSTTSPTTKSSEESVLGTGEDVWIQTFDQATGELASEFRAARYDPPQNGLVHVIKPEARFYTSDGRVLTVAARDGRVIMPEQTRRSDRMDSIQGAPPTRGTLYSVTIGILPDPDSTEPTLVCWVPVIGFDNDALRLNTIETEIDGRIIPPDRVPVTVRGQEYDFDGQGLTIRWNQRDQRLEHLEIAHGQRLVVKMPGAFGKLPVASVEKWDSPLPIQLVSNDPVDAAKMSAEEIERRRQKRLAAARRAAALAATQAVREPLAYRATFSENVLLFEGEKQIGMADRLLATFTFDDPPDEKTDTAARQLSDPTSQPAIRSTTRPTTRRTAKPVTEPVQPQEPIEVRWSGKLTVEPRKLAESGLRSAGDRAMQFDGSPVKLQRAGSQIEAATIGAASEGNRFTAKASEQFPLVTLTDATGTKLTAPAIEMVGDIATVQGVSRAELSIKDDAGRPQPLIATWNKLGTLRMSTNQAGSRVIESATLEGDVSVKHPQLGLTSDTLALAFDSAVAGADPVIKAIDATGAVKAKIINEASTQHVAAGALSLTTTTDKAGKVAFSGFKASDKVILSDAEQSLAADRVEGAFAQVEREGKSRLDIDQLTAAGAVTFEGQNDVTANADTLLIARKDGVQQITLQGKNASVGDAQSRLRGTMIKIGADSSYASVVGPGSLSGLSRAGEGKKPTPVTVTWADSFDYIAGDNQAIAAGDVRVESVGDDGSIQRGSGVRLTIALTDAPINKEKSEKANAMGDKVLQSIKLEKDVELSSLLYAAGADQDKKDLLRRVHLFAPGVTVLAGETNGTLGAVTIPTGGRMLYEDRRTSDPATRPVVPEPANAVRGAVAIEWAKSMRYDPKSNAVELLGDVVVVHQEAGEAPVRLLTQKLIAELDAKAEAGQQQLKVVRCEDGASFSSPQIRFDAANAHYEPAANRIVARGTERQPVEVYDQKGISSGSFEELWWNLTDARPERLKNVAGTIRR